MFTKRKDGMGIVFAGHYIPGQILKDTIENGDSVELHVGGERVLVKDIQSLPSQKFRSTVYGFEPSQGVEFQGFKIDDVVEFNEEHIFICSSK